MIQLTQQRYISITLNGILPQVQQKKIKYKTTKKRNLLLRKGLRTTQTQTKQEVSMKTEDIRLEEFRNLKKEVRGS
ncbi:MAG: hypothetical protein NTV89_03690, partial [Proteobacteria bacterium]|nr:hypothetical protein [Pseudomonadota bacterium]